VICSSSPAVASRCAHTRATVDTHGDTAVHSGARSLGVHTHLQGAQAVAAGNLLKHKDVIAELLSGYSASASASFEERLLDGLQAALATGGEDGPVHSAGMVVVEEVSWPVTDLRADYSDDPVADLVKLWQVWKPQKDDYRARGVDPTRAPTYGVLRDL
jgi:uncharacterized Ntn-hydrolase superfamily protein